ncbi:MAG: hypothetical protein ABSB11_05475 [Sedimentisphaerales bacterium]|jgi:hypothetical protein
MKIRKEQSEEWCGNINKIIQAVDEAAEDLEAIEKQLGYSVQATDSDQTLWARLRKVKALADKIHEYFCRSWVGKMAAGQPMTEKEFRLMQASGCVGYTAKNFGLSPVSDYEVFMHCCYEDDKGSCYINPGKKRPVFETDAKTGNKYIRIQFGRYPEELHTKNLRPKQRVFFETHLPAVYRRFRKD